jgi:hypothetical protein
MGIPFSQKEVPKKSLQQEMYSQIRKKMDITDFYKKQNDKLEKEIQENITNLVQPQNIHQ